MRSINGEGRWEGRGSTEGNAERMVSEGEREPEKDKVTAAKRKGSLKKSTRHGVKGIMENENRGRTLDLEGRGNIIRDFWEGSLGGMERTDARWEQMQE